MPQDETNRLALQVKRVVRTVAISSRGETNSVQCESGGNTGNPPGDCSRSRLLADKLEVGARKREELLMKDIQAALDEISKEVGPGEVALDSVAQRIEIVM